MPIYTTGQAVLQDVLRRAEELGIGASDMETEARLYTQAGYIWVLMQGPAWKWALKRPPGVLTTEPEVTAGTVNVLHGSTTITFSQAPEDPAGLGQISVAGYRFFVDDEPHVYRIVSHTATSTAAALDGIFIGTTNPTARYHVFKDEYSLAADFLRPGSRKKFLIDMQGGHRIDLLDETELDTRAGYPRRSGSIPEACALVSENEVRLYPWPTARRRYEYPYVHRPPDLTFDGTAGDTLIIQPPEAGISVIFAAVAQMLKDKDDSRSNEYGAAAAGQLTIMTRFHLKHQAPRVWVRSGSSVGTRR